MAPDQSMPWWLPVASGRLGIPHIITYVILLHCLLGSCLSDCPGCRTVGHQMPDWALTHKNSYGMFFASDPCLRDL